MNNNALALARTFDDRLQELLLNAPFLDRGFIQIKKLVCSRSKTTSHIGNIAQTNELAFAFFKDRKEDIRRAEEFATPFLADILARGRDPGRVLVHLEPALEQILTGDRIHAGLLVGHNRAGALDLQQVLRENN